MSQGSVTVDIKAQVTGYEASLQKMKAEFSKIDVGSDIGKKLAQAIQVADSQLKALMKNMTPQASSNTQIDAIVNKVNTAGEAIRHVADLLQQVTVGSVDFSPIKAELDGLSSSLTKAKAELEANLMDGLTNAISQSEQLSGTLQKIGISTEGKSTGQFFEELAQKAQEAAQATEEAQNKLAAASENLAKAQGDLEKNQQNPLADKNAVKDQLRGLVDEYQKALGQLGESLRTNLTSMLNGDSAKADEMAKVFLNGLTPETLKNHIMQLKDSVQQLLGKDAMPAKQIYENLFGNFGKGGNATAVSAAMVKQLFPPEIRQQFEQIFNTFSTQLTNTQAGTIKELISEGDLEAAYQKSATAIEKRYTALQGIILKCQQAVNDAMSQKQAAQEEVNSASAAQANIESVKAQLEATINTLRQENADLRARIDSIEKGITERKEGFVKDIQKKAGEEGSNASELTISTQEALKYKSALEAVQSSEQLIGKIQGVAQRWFSIYAAVRMAGNAIRDVISTVKELDKTITEIAIVTDMKQSDLWSQMDSYTQMARQYGSSISGVYKVSQLYYQQGLQTSEVMALTEQTLKMARISGLDYATATDYMTNAIRSFKMEMNEAQTVVDVYSAIAASSATSTTELATAMSKTASSAQAVGSSFENTTAMMAVMIEATRESAENIGSAMKSIISRYGEMTSDPSATVDSEGEDMSLNRVDKALQTVGISIHDTAGQFRDFDDVITELAQKWDTIDTNTQRYIATIMA